MLHLDDPHCDAMLALKDGTVAGRAGVLAVGDIEQSTRYTWPRPSAGRAWANADEPPGS